MSISRFFVLSHSRFECKIDPQCQLLVFVPFHNLRVTHFSLIIAGSLESANSSILAARRHFKEVVGKKIRIL